MSQVQALQRSRHDGVSIMSRARTLTRGDRWLTWISGVCVLASVPACIRIARAIPLHVPLDRNEGWNAYQAAAAIAGRLYPHPPDRKSVV